MSQPTPSLTLFGRPTHACPNLVKLTHHAGARTVEPCASPSSLRRRPASPGDEPARRPRVGAGTSVGHNANWRSVGVRERNVSSLCNIIARRWALPQGVPRLQIWTPYQTTVHAQRCARSAGPLHLMATSSGCANCHGQPHNGCRAGTTITSSGGRRVLSPAKARFLKPQEAMYPEGDACLFALVFYFAFIRP